MKYQVSIGKHPSIVVDLPDLIPDGQIFAVQVGERQLWVRWQRASGSLSFIEDAPFSSGNKIPLERNCQIRSRLKSQFDGDPATTIHTELLAGSSKGLQCLEAQVSPYVPGQAQRQGSQANQNLVVRSQISGKVLKVLVQAGQHIETGQALLIIEAMKMENRIFASNGGIIQKISVREGDNVGVGKELVRLMP